VLSVEGDAGPAVDFASVVCSRAVAFGLEKGLPIRGAVGYGPYLLEGTILVGQAVDEVAAWYESTEWIGVHLTPSAALRKGTEPLTKLQKTIYHSYPIPVKVGKPIRSLAVAWPRAWRFDLEKEPTQRKQALIDQFLSLGPLLPEVTYKIINAIEFYDEVIKSDPREKKK
jgi:hypothetical protein